MCEVEWERWLMRPGAVALGSTHAIGRQRAQLGESLGQ